jgi:NAD(P)-dependent dehydrogenase (short-subunit alcohol dehydrogenase family)
MTNHVLVTGASTGIGRAAALHLDGKGWKVFAGVRKEADGDALRTESSDRLVPVILDVTDEQQVEAVAKQIDAVVGDAGLNGLVNNAGVAKGGPVEFLDLETWRFQLEVNVVGQVAVTKANMAAIRRARGRIVFIGSISARVAAPMMGPYSASKAAIEAIGETLRHELKAWGIGVTVIEPGAIKTDIWDKGQVELEKVKASLSPEAIELYRDFVDEMGASIAESNERAISADVVARAVERALVSPHPLSRHLVGLDAKAAGVLGRVLPDRAKDFLVRTQL